MSKKIITHNNGIVETRETFYTEKTIQQLKQQLEEKDKEIELLKHLGSHETNMELFKENAKLIIEKRQFAISELEKVKEWLEPKYFDYEQINYLSKIIDQQIKKLKGEK